jgi:hypothetical protein
MSRRIDESSREAGERAGRAFAEIADADPEIRRSLQAAVSVFRSPEFQELVAEGTAENRAEDARMAAEMAVPPLTDDIDMWMRLARVYGTDPGEIQGIAHAREIARELFKDRQVLARIDRKARESIGPSPSPKVKPSRTWKSDRERRLGKLAYDLYRAHGSKAKGKWNTHKLVKEDEKYTHIQSLIRRAKNYARMEGCDPPSRR